MSVRLETAMTLLGGQELVVRTHAEQVIDTLRAQLEAAEAEVAENEAAFKIWRRLAEAAEADAARWQHARKLLAIEDVENLQAAYESFGRMTNEYECARADAAIDAAMSRTKEETK